MDITATERKVLVLCTFAAGVLCLFPLQWVSGVALLLLATIFHYRDLKITEREEREAEAAARARSIAEGGAEPSVTPSTEPTSAQG